MKELKVRMDDGVWTALRRTAKEHERSLNKEVLVVLKTWLKIKDLKIEDRQDRLLAEVGMEDYERGLRLEDQAL